MKVIEITDDNAEDYEDFFDKTVLNDVGREYHGGLLIENDRSDGVRAAVFWELKNAEVKGVDTTSEIVDLIATDTDGCEEVLKAFDDKGVFSGVKSSYFEFDELDEDRKEALENDGFKVSKDESRDIYITVGDLRKLTFAKKKPPAYITSLAKVSERQFKTGVMTSVLHGRYGLLDDLPFLPMDWFDKELSSCVITDGAINGLLLISKISEGVYRVELLCAMQPDAQTNLLNLLRYSIRAALINRSLDDVIILRRHSPETEALVKKLFPDKKGAAVIRGEKVYG